MAPSGLLLCIAAVLMVCGDSFAIFRPVAAFQPPYRMSMQQWHQRGVQPCDHRALFASTDGISSEDKGAKSGSINDILHELGTTLKSKAKETGDRANMASTNKGRITNAFVSSLYYLLFFVYRAYRGFFVLLPAVFKRVYSKLETAMEDYESEESQANTDSKQAVTWKTRCTVGLCAVVVTVSYALGGSFHIVKTFVRAVVNTKSLPESFGAAAEAMEGQKDSGTTTLGTSSNDGLLP